MSGPNIRVACDGAPPAVAAQVEPLLGAAAGDLDLRRHVAEVRLVVDDLPGDDDAWFGQWTADGERRLHVFCHVSSLTARGHAPAAGRVPQVWEHGPAPTSDPVHDEARPDDIRMKRFLYHHLLTARDVLDGTVRPRDLPHALAAAFTAAWAVGVDGRLERSGRPGYALHDRRARFSRLFASAGILMPDHWQIFQSLWDGALPDQKDVLSVLRQLPRL